MRRKTVNAFAAALILLPAIATAADAGERPAFGEADADGDGSISMEEAAAAGVPESEARREDIDNDGGLTRADWKFVDLEPEEDP